VAARGREAGTALGSDPAAVVAQTAARALAIVDTKNGTELVTTIAGGMQLSDYLPTCTFELAVHTADLATVIGVPPDVPATAAAQALTIITDLAVKDGLAGGSSRRRPGTAAILRPLHVSGDFMNTALRKALAPALGGQPG
jgi:hypothetical protein